MIASPTLSASSDPANLPQEVSRLARAVQQLQFLYAEMSAGESWVRGACAFFVNWFHGGRVVVVAYRCQRFWLLLLGRAYFVSLLWMWPLYWWCRMLGGRHAITPHANFGPGFRVIHCSMACVVTPFAVAGKNLYLTGGNVIGRRRKGGFPGDICLGDNVMLGIGVMVIGPLVIGDRIRIGAGAVVVKDVPAGVRVVSSPVRFLFPEVAA